MDFEVLPDRQQIDILLGLDNYHIMTALDERISELGEPHAIQTPLGWVASEGSANNLLFHLMRVSITPESQDEKILELQQTIRDLSLQNQAIQPSRNDRLAQQMVEGSNTKVVDGRHQMPVPFKDKISTLPNKYDLATKRLYFLRRRMLLKPEHGHVLTEAIRELRQNQYIIPAHIESKHQANYLSYFLTSQSKPRVVYDGSAIYEGSSINNCIHSGPNLINPLASVLTKFRMGQYALMADISKCFFSRCYYLRNNRISSKSYGDIQKREYEIYKFTRHVWRIIS